MPIILGIESTAHTFGISIVKNRKILSNVKESYTTEKSGIIPIEAAKHHEKIKDEVFTRALQKAKIKEKKIDAVAFSQGPGLAPCLIVGMNFAKEICKKLKIPLIPVNHCIAHLEIGKITGAKNPVMLYCSGANTQIIAYASGKYRILGETLDMGIGNFIDNFARYAGIGFPGGPAIQKLAEQSKNYIELPYTVKGMDVAFSGMLTNLKQKFEKMNLHSQTRDINNPELTSSSSSHNKNFKRRIQAKQDSKQLISEQSEVNYTLNDLSYSLQETAFAMLVETAERAMAHLNKNELLLGGGVACNKRLQKMCEIMCNERNAKLFVPPNELLVDNAGMIAYLGEIMFDAGIKFSSKQLNQIDIKPRERTDDVVVKWKQYILEHN